MSGDFKYDVAFSFLAQDEHLARKLNDLLASRVKTYIYSDEEHQRMLAGRDGEEHFNRVFGRESRTVAVLYRRGWGERGFTLAEATAIRNRAYEHGYDFTTFVPLDTPPVAPEWLPKPRIWVGLERWGIEHAAVVIESRIQEMGGDPREETPEEEAARTKRLLDAENERKAFLVSSAAIDAAERAFEEVAQELERICQGCPEILTFQDLGSRGAARRVTHILAAAARWNVVVGWSLPWSNTLDDSALRVVEWDRNPFLRYFEEIEPRNTTEFRFDVSISGDHGWRLQSDLGGRFFRSRDVASHAIRVLLARVRAGSSGSPDE